MKKVITIPDPLKRILDQHKDATGIPLTQYIQQSLIRQMLKDNLIKIKPRTVYVDEEGDVIETEDIQDKPLYCDSEKCELETYQE